MEACATVANRGAYPTQHRRSVVFGLLFRRRKPWPVADLHTVVLRKVERREAKDEVKNLAKPEVRYQAHRAQMGVMHSGRDVMRVGMPRDETCGKANEPSRLKIQSVGVVLIVVIPAYTLIGPEH